MEKNSYIKSFPDLMSGKKIMYLHGFMSSGQTGTVKLLKQLMPDAHFICEDIPLHPEEGFTFLQQLAEREKPDLIIGSSMGGMYGEQLYGFDRILVNPAFQMGETMSSLTGKQTFMNPRKDGVQEFMVTKSLIKEYTEFSHHCFASVTQEEQNRVYGLFGDNDPVVHTFDLFHQHYPNAIRFHGEHRLIDKVAWHYLIPVIRWIDDKQENRERPIIYINYEALHDQYDHPTSSMHKAYEALLDNYQVYIVATAPDYDVKETEKVRAWIEEYLSAPAYHHTIFTHRKSVLYGDYFIDPDPDENFMGTNLKYGSDEFKTWDEIITYFSRLGGQ
ncbi:hypothetical protein LPYR103PRE_18030 [Segatella asaccharophila]